MSGIESINLGIGIAALVVSSLGLMQVRFSVYVRPWEKQYFTVFFGVMVACALCNLAGQLLDNRPVLLYAQLYRVTMFLESALPSTLLLLLIVYLLRLSGEPDWRRHPLFRAEAVLWLVYFGLLVFTQFTTVIYSIDENGVYRRGPLYPILLVPPAAIMALSIGAQLRRSARLQRRERIAICLFLLIPLVSMLVQMRFYGLYTVLLGATIAAVFLFNYVWIVQSERYRKQEQELAKLRVDIMLSQIQPHFLYNTLGAIQSLCRTDPAMAEKAVAQFSRYLRGNMDSLTRESNIPFRQELDHTRLYLDLEKLRYEDALQVRYDLETEDFRIPTLTLQPLAENAVRHGVRGKPGGEGTVTISTREFPDRWEVTVEDDGPGFDPDKKPEDGRTHIGIANVRERLSRVAGGSLEIDSAPGRGTRARILLPKEKN